MSLINKMNVGNTNYDIQDRLMPDAIGQAGQVLKVKDDASGLEFGTIDSGGVQFVNLQPGRPLTEDALAILKKNKSNQIVYAGGVIYYFKLGYIKTQNEWVYETIVDSPTTLTVNMTTGSTSLDFKSGKLYKHTYTITGTGDGNSVYCITYKSTDTLMTISEVLSFFNSQTTVGRVVSVGVVKQYTTAGSGYFQNVSGPDTYDVYFEGTDAEFDISASSNMTHTIVEC